MSISGAETITATNRGHWQVSGRIVLKNSEAQLEWEGFLAQMQGGIGETLVPIYSDHRVPLADGRVPPYPELPNIATAEHFVFATEARLNIALRTPAAIRDTDLALLLADSARPRPGHHLSIGDRFYRVQHAWEGSDGPHVRVQPPLRSAHEAGERVVTDAPVCRMRLTGEGVGEITQTVDPVAFVDVSFVEAL